MGKNIVVCSDGTGNAAIKGRGTNVFKLFEAVDLNGHRTDPTLAPQIALYDDGVGTESFKPLRVLGGATGLGLSRNVRQLYKELCRVYDPGDRIFLFGFSRGAFTVRSLAGFIGTCGILDVRKLGTAAALEARVREAYRGYRKCYRTALVKALRGPVDPREMQEFRELHSHPGETRIAFIGVWDTVDAVGLPFHLADVVNALVYQFKFPGFKLGAFVDQGCHALAVDDARHSFHPLLWDEREESREQPRIEQVWFAGAHSNVGGGYPKQGMSLVALDWMMERAGRADLRFLPLDRSLYRDHASVDDKLYDPRAGLGVFYRWKPRDIAEMCSARGVKPKLHMTVLERAAHGTEDYVPGNVPPEAEVVWTRSGVPDEDLAAEERARHLQETLRQAWARERWAGDAAQGGEGGEGRRSLLAKVRRPLLVGHLSYYVYLLSCTAALAVAAAALWTPGSGRMAALGVGLAGVVSGLVVAYGMAAYAERVMSATFSEFWHDTQQSLRDALKRARQVNRERSSHAA